MGIFKKGPTYPNVSLRDEHPEAKELREVLKAALKTSPSLRSQGVLSPLYLSTCSASAASHPPTFADVSQDRTTSHLSLGQPVSLPFPVPQTSDG